jgi:rare lipoprotein A
MRRGKTVNRLLVTGNWPEISNAVSILASRQWPAALLSGLLLSACSTQPTRTPSQPPPDVASVPDAVPKPVTRSTRGNPPFYDVLGKRYFVKASAEGVVERGVASWYGPGFHKENTSTGEPYDMYAMTAAHTTLPIPFYARVTNLSNGKSVVVYVNDRGPFKDGRIVDLSLAAATKLDMIKAGTALVELEVITVDGASPSSLANTKAVTGPIYVQAGAFGEAANAERLVTRLKGLGYSQAFALRDRGVLSSMYRVRIGPITKVDEYDRIVAHLKSLGIGDAHLASAE